MESKLWSKRRIYCVHVGAGKMNFYSHTNPNKELIKHLQEVADFSVRYGDDRFEEVHRIIGYAHDFGKYTTFFQEDRLFKLKSWGKKANHAYLSAIFGAFLCMKNKNLSKTLHPLWAFSVILSHHGDIKQFSGTDYLPDLSRGAVKFREANEKLKIIDIQIENMIKNQRVILNDYDKVGLKSEVEEFLSNKNIIKEVLRKLNNILLEYEDSPDEQQFWIHQILYSALISADKISAAGLKPIEEKNLKFAVLISNKNKIIQGYRPCKLDKMRNDIFNSVLNNIQKVFLNNSIFSITAPTGTGKTYTGFFTAKKLQELLGYKHKIIYALPFTSIIDQNYQRIEELHRMDEDFKNNRSLYLIKHHHLSNPEYVNENEDYRMDQSELLIENWESGIVITTFVQLLQTLVGNRNRMLKKFHAITNSIILLDEVQAIPIEYYELVNYAIQKLVEVYDCKVILMTATKPLIFSKTTELLGNYEVYFSQLCRTILYPKLDKVTIEEFCDDFIRRMEPDKSYLIVCNTIAQSLNVYNILSDNGTKEEYKYLSTNLLPIHRKETLKELESISTGKRTILISTQVVEAGVDLDFDEVIRDIGPLDSIIQCAGRCNRRWDRENGNVTVVNMVDEKGYSFASRVYGSVIINITWKLLSGREKVPEKDFEQLIQEYYSLILSGKVSMQESKDLIKALKNLDFGQERGVGSFSLIKEKQSYVSLYIEYDDHAVSLFEEFKDAFMIEDMNERRNKMKEIRREMLNYTISVPEKLARRYQPVFSGDNDLFIIYKDDVERHYCKNTGLKRDEDFEMFCF